MFLENKKFARRSRHLKDFFGSLFLLSTSALTSSRHLKFCFTPTSRSLHFSIRKIFTHYYGVTSAFHFVSAYAKFARRSRHLQKEPRLRFFLFVENMAKARTSDCILMSSLVYIVYYYLMGNK